MVLTQLKVEDNRARKRQFPYHYGSYATGLMLHFQAESMTSFHTTMVLTQRNSGISCRGAVEPFPYHYGSYATVKKMADALFTLMRFPYHYGSYATGIE